MIGLDMESTSRPRSTRDRPAKAPLSEDVILDTALRLVKEEGLEAVTMRRIATELDTGPASLYVYISGREALRSAMLDRLTASIELEPPDPDYWREQVHRLLLRTLHRLEEYPGIAAVAVGTPAITEQVMRFLENLLSILLAGGVREKDAAWAVDILLLIVTACAVENEVHRSREDDKEELVAGLTAAFRSLPVEHFPVIWSLMDDLTAGDGDDRFVFAVDVFLDGLVARAARD
jgi:AcrR family transcriptional regulator